MNANLKQPNSSGLDGLSVFRADQVGSLLRPEVLKQARERLLGAHTADQNLAPHDHGVSSRSYVDALIMGPGNTSGTQALGYYDDVLVLRSDGWKIARRRFTLVCMQSVVPLEFPLHG